MDKSNSPKIETETAKSNQEQWQSQLQRTPIAIIGMASIFPKARNLREFWENVVGKVDCITDVPASRWNIEDYYDPDPNTPDKTYSRRGGFIPDIDFNPMEFGLPPNILEVTDVAQLLSLVVAKAAMEDAGYGESRNFSRERTGVILGVVGGSMQLIVPLTTRLQYPVWEKVLKSSGLSDKDTQKIIEKIKLAYVGWEENSFPGWLANVIAGRIANRLNLGGINCVVDAACASSLSGVKMAVSELVEGRCDMMIAGGVETDNSMLTYMSFSKTPAFSKKQQCRPFDVDADGMMASEGIGMMVLKRLADAERDGDRIYAAIKGIGTSSDGRYKSIYAPSSDGQVKALHRAYEDAGFPATSVGLIEAHGTGTVAGDWCEFKALNKVFGEDSTLKRHIALGSVKSQIGHAKATAGAASLIKTALALHHKILPATINVTRPNPKFGIEDSPFYLNTETQPWIRREKDTPRRAGVSAFGFGGTNYHVVLEEYGDEQNSAYRLHTVAQSVLLHAPTSEQLLTGCETVLEQLKSDAGSKHYSELVISSKSLVVPTSDARVGFVAKSLAEACELLQIAISRLNGTQAACWEHPRGIYYRQAGFPAHAKVVALFPGQGSQYLDMGRELACNFPPIRQAYSSLDNLFVQDGLQPITHTVFCCPIEMSREQACNLPPLHEADSLLDNVSGRGVQPVSQVVFCNLKFESNQRAIQVEALQRTEYAQPAIGAFSAGLYKILQQAGFKPDFFAGHSFGELTALWAAEVLSDADYFYLIKARGQAMATPHAGDDCDAGAMLAVNGEASKIQEIIRGLSYASIANYNSPNQVVLSGTKPEIATIQQILSKHSYSVTPLPVSAAFHTRFVSYASQPFSLAVQSVTLNSPKVPVYSNTTGEPYPTDAGTIQEILEAHLLKPVLFQQEIENIYAAGGYCFVEIGPRQILTNLVKNILGDRPYLAVALNPSREKDSDLQLRQAVMQLRVAGLPLQNLDPYQVEPLPVEIGKDNRLNVRLGGGNYLSEKTKAAFEKALQDGYQIERIAPLAPAIAVPFVSEAIDAADVMLPEPAIATAENTSSLAIAARAADVMLLPATASAEVISYVASDTNAHVVLETPVDTDVILLPSASIAVQDTPADVTDVTPFSIIEPEEMLQSISQSSANAQPIVAANGLEKLLTQFCNHQSEVLRVHEQYLKNQAECSQAFFQLVQQNSLVLAGSQATSKWAELPEAAAPVEYQQPMLAAQTAISVAEPQVTPVAATMAVNRQEIPANPFPSTLVTKPSVNPPTNTPPTEPATIQVHSPKAVTSEFLMQVISHRTGYPTELLDPEMNPRADLGIDTVKWVEIVEAIQELMPMPKVNPSELAQQSTISQVAEYIRRVSQTQPSPEVAAPSAVAVELAQRVVETQPSPNLTKTPSAAVELEGVVETQPSPEVAKARSAVAVELASVVETQASPEMAKASSAVVPVATPIEETSIAQSLLTVVSEKTGYPVEMLDMQMDMEADLGIDSIKRVEIIGAMQELFSDLPKLSPEELGEQRSLRQIAEYLLSKLPKAEKKIA